MKKGLFTLFLTFMMAVSAYAVMAPEYYQKAIKNSDIKTAAVVKKVKTVSNNHGNRIVDVYFESLYNKKNFEFSGSCYTFKKIFPNDQALIGPIFYYPKKGQEVYVTVASDGGWITSFTKMDDEFKDALLNHPEEIKSRFGKFYLDKK